MPHIVDHEVAAQHVRKGDVVGTQNDGRFPYGATVDATKVGTRWVTAYGPQRADDGGRDVLFRVELTEKVWVGRSEPTDDERAAARDRWLQERSEESLAALAARYDRAVAAVRKALDDGVVPDHGQLSALYAGQRAAQHAKRLTVGRDVHPDKSLYELFQMLRDELVKEVLRNNVARWSGGFTISNAQEQLWRDVDVDVIRAVDSGFMHAL